MAKSTRQEKLIKAVNERIKDIARTLGTESKLYNDYLARVSKAFGGKIYASTKDNVIQISHGKSVQEDPDLEEKLDFIKRLPTKGEVKRRARKSLKEEREEREERKPKRKKDRKDKRQGKKERERARKKEQEEILQRAKELDAINDFFENEKDNIYLFQEYAHIESVLKDETRGRRLTYDELADLISEYEEKKKGKLTPKDLFANL